MSKPTTGLFPKDLNYGNVLLSSYQFVQKKEKMETIRLFSIYVERNRSEEEVYVVGWVFFFMGSCVLFILQG